MSVIPSQVSALAKVLESAEDPQSIRHPRWTPSPCFHAWTSANLRSSERIPGVQTDPPRDSSREHVNHFSQI
jgi:hypothetical protein